MDMGLVMVPATREDMAGIADSADSAGGEGIRAGRAPGVDPALEGERVERVDSGERVGDELTLNFACCLISFSVLNFGFVNYLHATVNAIIS